MAKKGVKEVARKGAKEVARKAAKLGLAPALTETNWLKWVGFVEKRHSTAVALIIQMTGAFALRCVEACQLKAEDFHLEASPPYVDVPGRAGAAKSPGQVPIHPHCAKEIEALKATASPTTRTRGNQHKQWDEVDSRQWPVDEMGLPVPIAAGRSGG